MSFTELEFDTRRRGWYVFQVHLSLLYEDSFLTASGQYNVIEIYSHGRHAGDSIPFGRIEADERRVTEGGEMIGNGRISKRISGKKKRSE